MGNIKVQLVPLYLDGNLAWMAHILLPWTLGRHYSSYLLMLDAIIERLEVRWIFSHSQAIWFICKDSHRILYIWGPLTSLGYVLKLLYQYQFYLRQVCSFKVKFKSYFWKNSWITYFNNFVDVVYLIYCFIQKQQSYIW